MSSVDAESLIREERKEKPFRLWVYIHEISINKLDRLMNVHITQSDSNKWQSSGC